MTFEVSKTETQKHIFFFELTDNKWIFFKVRSDYLNFLKNYQNFSVSTLYFILFICKYTVKIWFNLFIIYDKW